MNTKWLVALSDGTTWELVSPGIRLYKVDENKVMEVGDRLRELTDQEEGIALVDLLSSKAHYGDWSFEERIVAHMGENGVDLGRRSFDAHDALAALVGKAGFDVLASALGIASCHSPSKC